MYFCPGLRRQDAAGQPVGRCVIVVAEPDGGRVIAGEADEPGILVGVGGAGLAGDVDAGKAGAPRRCRVSTTLCSMSIMPSTVVSCSTRCCGCGIGVGVVDDLAGRGAHVDQAARLDAVAAIGEDGIARRLVEHRQLRAAERQRARDAERRRHAHPRREVGDRLAAGLDRKPHRDRVQRLRERARAASAGPCRSGRNSAATSCRSRPARRRTIVSGVYFPVSSAVA